MELTKNCPRFTFYDGPPFATGLPHYGHMCAGTIKVNYVLIEIRMWSADILLWMENMLKEDLVGIVMVYQLNMK